MEKHLKPAPTTKDPKKISEPLAAFFLEAQKTLRPDQMIMASNSIRQLMDNSLGHLTDVPAIFLPGTHLEIQSLVALANRYGVPLYAVSLGKNIGYGEMCPPTAGQVVLSLENMNQISEFDSTLGEVTLEPGVTQIQLVDYLREHGNQWIADVTGASPESSIVGNTLDGGFGHTPLGNRREHILEVVGVLGHGASFRTGEFPGLGPNLASLFIQSNFGIVTSLRIRLFRRPESILTYVIQFKNHDTFLEALPTLLELRQLGVIPSLLHIANATRVFMSANEFPSHIPRSQILSGDDCMRLMKNPFTKTSPWSGIGGLYGGHRQVKESLKILESRLRPFGKLQYFSTQKFKVLRMLIEILFWKSSKSRKLLKGSLDSIEAFHNLCQGIPSWAPSEHILWKTKQRSDLGLIWIGPVIKASSETLNHIVDLIQPVFKEYGFEFPMTITFVDHAHLICILNICFDKSNLQEVERAHLAYAKIESILVAHKIHSYRKGILRQEGIPQGRLEAISQIKKALDPQGIMAPGRYGIAGKGT